MTLVIRGIGININVYSDAFLWKYIIAFLILRIIGLIWSFVILVFGNYYTNRILLFNKIGNVVVI